MKRTTRQILSFAKGFKNTFEKRDIIKNLANIIITPKDIEAFEALKGQINLAVNILSDMGYIEKLREGSLHYRLTAKGYSFKSWEEVEAEEAKEKKHKEMTRALTQAEYVKVIKILNDYDNTKIRSWIGVVAAVISAILAIIIWEN